MPILLPEFASFTDCDNLFLGKVRESDDDSFCLHALELLEVDMVNSFVPYLYVGVGFMAICKHR